MSSRSHQVRARQGNKCLQHRFKHQVHNSIHQMRKKQGFRHNSLLQMDPGTRSQQHHQQKVVEHGRVLWSKVA